MSDKNMSPDVSPSGLEKVKTGVRRVNNVPVMIFAGIVVAFLLVMTMVASDRANKSVSAEKEEKTSGNSNIFADQIVGDRVDGLILPELSEPEPVEIEEPEVTPKQEYAATNDGPPMPFPVTQPTSFEMPPMPPSLVVDEEAQRFRQAKVQMFEEAVKARSTVSVAMPRSSGSSRGNAPSSADEAASRLAALRQKISAQQANDPTAAYQQRVNQIRESLGIQGDAGSGGGDMALLSNNSGGGGGYENDGADRWELGSKVQAPRTPYEIRSGFVIPATLISGINSSLPGQIIAQVSQNVYDTATGSHLLVPQGSRLVGNYGSDVEYGQSRVLIGWQRIIFPDGKALDIGDMPGADGAGYSGFKDKVNNHYFRIFGSAFLMSGVTAGVALSQDTGSGNGDDRQRASDAMSEALGQQLGQVTAAMIAKNLNIAPTLEIRPGYRFNVVVTKDMSFSKAYESFDY